MRSIQNTKTSGEVPLHIVIQCRCKVSWGLQDKLSKCIQKLGLTEIDHRSWHPRGTDAVVVTEIYAQDPQTMILLQSKVLDDMFLEEQGDKIQHRCDSVLRAVNAAIAQIGANVQVTQWLPNVLAKEDHDLGDLSEHIEAEARSRLDRDEEIGTLLEEVPEGATAPKGKRLKMVSVPSDSLRSQQMTISELKEESELKAVTEELEHMENGEEASDQHTPIASLARTRRRPRHKTLSVPAFAAGNMWDQPSEAEIQNIAMRSNYVPVVTYDMSVPSYGSANRRRQVSDLSTLFEHSAMLPTVEEQLEGFVRHSLPTNDENNKDK